ncbi:MAG: hypothetical protein EKK64_00885 [Neisseriaceae bacterium]|nr:MAG: hypothetical protein EKK64_00885 [Neisseriaceae bacterium]
MYCLLIAIKTNAGYVNRHWRKNGVWHRGKDLPAKIYGNGDKAWLFKGRIHRDNDLPAIQHVNGYKAFFLKGKQYLYRKQENGTKEYYDIHGRLHKKNSPAIIYSNGDKEYWIDGMRHRANGPAVILGKKKYYFKKGEFIKCIVK